MNDFNKSIYADGELLSGENGKNNGRFMSTKNNKNPDPESQIPKILINCADAKDMLDLHDWDAPSNRQILDNHFKNCPACKRDAEIEPAIRAIIAPAVLPQVSEDFERILFARLDLGTAAKEVEMVKVSPVARWGWIAGALGAAIAVATQINLIINLIGKAGILVYAQFVKLFAGKTFVSFDEMLTTIPHAPGMDDVMMFNLIMAAIVLAGGYFAVNWISRK